jgi:hypothetical protein
LNDVDDPKSRRSIVTTQRRLTSVAAVTVAALLGLSGCGGDLGPDLHPGTAAVVGDMKISLDTVDTKAKELCRFGVESGQLESAVPMASVRSSYLQTVIDHELAQQFVEHIGAADDPALTEQVRAARAETETQVASLDPGLRAIFEEMSAKTAYISIVSGLGGDDYAAFVKEADVVRDPRFPALDAEGAVVSTGDLSVPVSDLARSSVQAETQEEYDAYLAALPASQKCGTSPDA